MGTHTFARTNIVVYRGPGAGTLIFAEDFGVTTDQNVAVYDEVAKHLDKKHLRRFWSMCEFTKWLHEVGAVVDRCWLEVKPLERGRTAWF